jgi:hypothetical protein
VPRLRGNRLDTARRKLARNGCRKGLVERRRDGQKVRPGRWRVMESDPGAGGQLARFAKVDLVLVPRRVLRAASP